MNFLRSRLRKSSLVPIKTYVTSTYRRPDSGGFFRSKKFKWLIVTGVFGGLAYYKFKPWYELRWFLPPEWNEINISKSLQEIIDTYGKESEKAALQLHKEAKILMLSNETEEARKMLSLALDLMSDIKGENSIETAEILVDLASILLEENHKTAALIAIENAVKRFIHNSKYEEAFRYLEHVPILKSSTLEEINEEYQKIITQRKEKFGAKDPGIARTYLRLAAVYLMHDNIKQSQEYYQKAMEIIENQEMTPSQKFENYMTLAEFFTKKNAYAEVIHWTHKAIENMDQEDEASKFVVYSNLADHYSKVDDHKSAIESLKKALEIIKQYSGIDKNIGKLYTKIAEEYLKESQLKDAIETYLEGKAYFNKIGDRESAISNQFESCKILLKMNQQEGIKCLEEARELAAEYLGEYSTLTSSITGYLRYQQKQFAPKK